MQYLKCIKKISEMECNKAEKSKKALKKLYSFEPKQVQIDANFQLRERDLNLGSEELPFNYLKKQKLLLHKSLNSIP
jgi:hypothetical protein